ncbi:MAG: hypothetical protein JWN75_176 [Candidatus Saccharibacteria bacterium]|nr:hypothetical protein [Candidatus Saccharibacteria bacterium]
MARQRVIRALFAGLFAPVLGVSPALANAANYEINVGGVGYRYDSTDASYILQDSPFRTPGATQYYIHKESEYPNTGTDASIVMGAASTLALIHKICESDSTCQISGFGGSNGSNVLSEVNDIMMKTNDPLIQRLKLYGMVNPRDPYGGVAGKFPVGSTVPFTGVTAGSLTQPGGAYFMSFRDEYDPISDFPSTPFNMLANVNAFLGFFFVHPQVNANVLDPRNVVTSSEDGRFVSVLVYTERLPILQLVGFLPEPILQLFDALLRPIIDSAYVRPGPSGPTMQEIVEQSTNTVTVVPAVTPQQKVAAVQQVSEEPVTQPESRRAEITPTVSTTSVDETSDSLTPSVTASTPTATTDPVASTTLPESSVPTQARETTTSSQSSQSTVSTSNAKETKTAQTDMDTSEKSAQPKASKPSLESSDSNNQPNSSSGISGASSGSSSSSSSSSSSKDAGSSDS